MTTPQFIKKVMAEKKMNANQLSIAIGFNRSQVSKWLKGQEMKFSTATDICNKLGLSLSSILHITNQQV